LFMVAAVLLPQRLRDVMGADAATAAFGVINACTAFISLLSNLVVGNLSDHTRSRFGRRTPWVISGGIVGGVSLALVGFLDNVWLIGISYCVCMIGLNMMIAPVIATLSDRVPANMRGTMSAFLAGGTAVGSALGQMLGVEVPLQSDPRIPAQRHSDGAGRNLHGAGLAKGAEFEASGKDVQRFRGYAQILHPPHQRRP
jgi:MFS family permease